MVKRKTDSSVSDSSEFETRQERGRSGGRGAEQAFFCSHMAENHFGVCNVTQCAEKRNLAFTSHSDQDYASAKSPLRMRIASHASQRQMFKKRFLWFFHPAQTHVVDARLCVFFH